MPTFTLIPDPTAPIFKMTFTPDLSLPLIISDTITVLPIAITPFNFQISWTTSSLTITGSWTAPQNLVSQSYTITFLNDASTFQVLTTNNTSQSTTNTLISGATYTATLFAFTQFGQSPTITSTSIIPLTATPTVTVSWTTGNSYVTCSWVSLTGATNYTVIFLQNSSTFQTVSGVSGTSQNSSTLLVSGETYSATVMARNTYGDSPVGTGTITVPLTATPTVTISWASGNGYVTCSWISLTGATTYTVAFIQNSSAFQTDSGLTGTFKNSTVTVSSGVECTATVIAVNSYGNSPLGTSSNSIIPLTAVSTVSLSWSTNNLYVTCSWTSLTGAVTYTIAFIQNSIAFQTIAYATGTSINSAITLTPGVSCTATVVAVNTYGTSPTGTSSAVVPLTEAPSSVSISWTSGNTYLTCTWAALTGATASSYTVIFLQNGSTFQTFTNVSGTSQNSSTTLTSGSYYTATVTGANSYGTSITGTSASSIIPLTTAPTSITLTYTASSSSMNCAWVAASGAFIYTVAFLQSGSAFQTISTVIGTSQKSSTALTAGLTYTVTVIGYNLYGNTPTGSGNSAPAGSSMSGLSLSFSSGTATMSWSAYSGVSGGYTWILYQNASNSVTGGTINAYGTTSGISVTATTYSSNYYYFTVVATTATGTSLLTTSSVVQSTYSSGIPTQPSSIANLLMWFDASDTSTVFQNEGGTTPSTNLTRAALWKDKSGGLRNAVGAIGGYALYETNVLNGLAGIKFNSSTLNLPTLNLSPISIFMVGRLVVFSQNIMVSLTGGTGIYLRASGGSAVPTYTSYGIDYGAAAFRYTTATAITDLNSHVWSFTLPSTGYGVFTFDGTPGLGNGFTASQIAASSSTASFGCYAQNPNNAPMNGYLNEVIIFNTNISAANQTLMEGYLAWKWGLQANLPAGHTYKSAAPSSGSGAPSAVTGMAISFATNIATMSWSAYSGSTGYSWVLFQATTSSAAGYPISTSTTSSSTTSATYTGLTTGYYYYFAVYSTATINSAYGTSTASLFTAVLPTGGSIVLNTLTVSSGTVTITAASNATSYRVYISTSTSLTNSVYSFTTSTTGSAVGFTPSPSLVVSTTYYAIVIPTNASGNGSTAFSSGLTISGAVPTGGSITFNGIYSLTSASITITAATNATLYTVYLSTSTSTANQFYSFTTSITGSAIVFSPSLSLSTTYYAIVIPSNTFGNGTTSVSSGIITAVPSGGSIVLNSITSTTNGTVTITAASSATLYTVYISTTTSSANSVYSFTTTTTGSAVAFTSSTPLLISTTYYAIVIASNTFGNGTPAVSSSLVTSVPTGGSVVLNSISTPTSGTVTITAATNTSLYTVYISTTTSSANSVYSFTTTTTGSAIAFTPSSALSAGTYYAVVIANNSFGDGTAFVSASITKSIPTGGSVILNSITSTTSGTLTITASTDATLYTVYISTTTSSANSVYSFTTTTTGSTIAFTPSPALTSGTYYAVVVPSNPFGNGTALVSGSLTISTPTGGSVTLNSLTLTSGSVTITAASGATSYTVYISTTTSFTNSVYSFTTPTTGSAVAFTPSPSLAYGTYYAIILPTNSFGNGSYVASAGVIIMYVLSGSLTFTPASATGSYGPTLSQCRTAYSAFGSWISNDTFFNMTRAGYQLWTVPSTKSYTIVMNGAFGYNTVGARLTFTTTLTQGHVMALVVGQGGSNWTTTCSNINSGGGGGSYLYNSTTATLLAVAGGGGGSTGGAGGGTNGNPTSTSGYNGYGTYNSLGNAAGGTNGGGGSSIFSSQGATQGGGGGGYTGNGANSVAGVEGGLSFTNGATGGACSAWQGGQGGFGGGAGAGNYTGGGGGGYSGGGGGWWQTSFVCTANGGGGGGGSYCFTTLTSSGLNSAAQGSITIT